jgi:hypothetical protein
MSRMAVMNVTQLSNLGYSSYDAELENPMDVRFLPREYLGTDLNQIKSKLLPLYAKLAAYPDPVTLSEVETEYWTDKPFLSADETGPQVEGNVDPLNQEFHDTMHKPSSASSAVAGSEPSAVASSEPSAAANSESSAVASTASSLVASTASTAEPASTPAMAEMGGMGGMSGMKDGATHNSHHGGGGSMNM